MIFLTLITLSQKECYHDSLCSFPIRKNIIQNNCNFNKINFNSNELLCSDYGINKKYCNSYSLPYKFTITKEFGVNNKENIIIKPYALWETDDIYFKKKVANFYYRFTCSSKDNLPKLILNIVPEKEFDKSFLQEVYELIYFICFLLVIITLLILIYPYNPNTNNNYWLGYSIGNSQNNHIRRIYCE